MLIQVCFLLHGHKCFVTNGRNSHFFQADALKGEQTPHQQIQRVNSTHRTDLKGWKSVLVHQRCANCVSLGALNLFQKSYIEVCNHVLSCSISIQEWKLYEIKPLTLKRSRGITSPPPQQISMLNTIRVTQMQWMAVLFTRIYLPTKKVTSFHLGTHWVTNFLAMVFTSSSLSGVFSFTFSISLKIHKRKEASNSSLIVNFGKGKKAVRYIKHTALHVRSEQHRVMQSMCNTLTFSIPSWSQSNAQRLSHPWPLTTCISQMKSGFKDDFKRWGEQQILNDIVNHQFTISTFLYRTSCYF